MPLKVLDRWADSLDCNRPIRGGDVGDFAKYSCRFGDWGESRNGTAGHSPRAVLAVVGAVVSEAREDDALEAVDGRDV